MFAGLSALPQNAFAQKVRLGIITGGSLTDDFSSPDSQPASNRLVVNESDAFIVGPKLELMLPKNLSAEVEALHRKIGSRTTIFLTPPIVLPDGRQIRQLGPFGGTQYTWQFSLLGKYRLPAQKMKPFFEGGASFLPTENRDQTGISAGSGVEIQVGKANFAPGIRYTRWVSNYDIFAGARNQVQFLIGVNETSSSVLPAAFGRELSLGFVTGLSVTNVIRGGSDTDTLVPGIMVEFPLAKRLSIEANGLYRAAHVRDGNLRDAFLTWEFPVLAKYRMSERKFRPFVEAGPSFRALAHTNSDDYSHHGITAGFGLETQVHRMKVAPALRYTRWTADRDSRGQTPLVSIRPNQVEVVIGFSF